MNEPSSSVERVLEYISHISGFIGPRPSGSQQEKAAHDYLKTLLDHAGLRSEYQTFKFPSLPKFLPYLTIPGLFLLLVPFLPGVFKAILIFLPFIIAALPEIHNWILEHLPSTSFSQNLVAQPSKNTLEELDVLFCAHVDSGRIIPRSSWLFQGFLNHYMVLLEIYSWLLAIIGLLYLTIPKIAQVIQPITITLISLTGFALFWLDIWQQLGNSWKVSPGANDNASGAAVCATLAEDWETSDFQKNIKVGFLFTGAEEVGLFGAKAFVQQNPQIPKNLIVINIDMVGHGHRVGAVFRSGRFKPLYADSDLLKLIHQKEPNLVFIDYRYRGSDFLPFLKAGYRVISLEATENGGVPSTYHSEIDLPDTIQPEIISHITGLLKILLSDLDNQ